MDRKSGRFIHYRHNPSDSTTLSQDSLSRLFEDKMGGLWVSSDTGINYCYPKQTTILHAIAMILQTRTLWMTMWLDVFMKRLQICCG